MKKIISVFLALAMLGVAAFTMSCKPDEKDPITSEEEGDGIDRSEVLDYIVKDGVSEYQIVHSFSSLDAVAAIRDFASRIEEKTGAKIPVYDASKSAPAERTTEILIGCVDSREESRESYSTLSYSAWSIQTGRRSKGRSLW